MLSTQFISGLVVFPWKGIRPEINPFLELPKVFFDRKQICKAFKPKSTYNFFDFDTK